MRHVMHAVISAKIALPAPRTRIKRLANSNRCTRPIRGDHDFSVWT